MQHDVRSFAQDVLTGHDLKALGLDHRFLGKLASNSVHSKLERSKAASVVKEQYIQVGLRMDESNGNGIDGIDGVNSDGASSVV